MSSPPLPSIDLHDKIGVKSKISFSGDEKATWYEDGVIAWIPEVATLAPFLEVIFDTPQYVREISLASPYGASIKIGIAKSSSSIQRMNTSLCPPPATHFDCWKSNLILDQEQQTFRVQHCLAAFRITILSWNMEGEGHHASEGTPSVSFGGDVVDDITTPPSTAPQASIPCGEAVDMEAGPLSWMQVMVEDDLKAALDEKLSPCSNIQYETGQSLRPTPQQHKQSNVLQSLTFPLGARIGWVSQDEQDARVTLHLPNPIQVAAVGIQGVRTPRGLLLAADIPVWQPTEVRIQYSSLNSVDEKKETKIQFNRALPLFRDAEDIYKIYLPLPNRLASLTCTITNWDKKVFPVPAMRIGLYSLLQSTPTPSIGGRPHIAEDSAGILHPGLQLEAYLFPRIPKAPGQHSLSPRPSSLPWLAERRKLLGKFSPNVCSSWSTFYNLAYEGDKEGLLMEAQNLKEHGFSFLICVTALLLLCLVGMTCLRSSTPSTLVTPTIRFTPSSSPNPLSLAKASSSSSSSALRRPSSLSHTEPPPLRSPEKMANPDSQLAGGRIGPKIPKLPLLELE